MIAYLPDGREVTVTKIPGPVFKAVFAADPDGVFGHGRSAGASVESLMAADDTEAADRAIRRARSLPGSAGHRAVIQHIDGDPGNNDPGNLLAVNPRGNTSQDRLESQRQYLSEWVSRNSSNPRSTP
jgi:hypothetical protein